MPDKVKDMVWKSETQASKKQVSQQLLKCFHITNKIDSM